MSTRREEEKGDIAEDIKVELVDTTMLIPYTVGLLLKNSLQKTDVKIIKGSPYTSHTVCEERGMFLGQ